MPPTEAENSLPHPTDTLGQRLAGPGLDLCQEAIRRVIAGALLLSNFPEGLKFRDFRELMSGRGDYAGGDEAVQKALYRDHEALLQAGVEITYRDGAYRYLPETHLRHLGLDTLEVQLVTAAILTIEASPGGRLPAALLTERLLMAGAPLIDLRLALDPLGERRRDVVGRTAVAVTLLGALQGARDQELDPETARLVCRCGSPGELLHVARALEAVSVPFVGTPEDEAPVLINGGVVMAHLSGLVLPAQRLSREEAAPLLHALLAGPDHGQRRRNLVAKLRQRVVRPESPQLELFLAVSAP